MTGLIGNWGGESVSFNHREGRLARLLGGIGDACAIEVALPISATTRAACAAENVLDAYSFLLGCSGEWGGGCDLVAVVPIPADWITAIHVEGDGRFEAFGRSYPENFVADSR